MFICNTFLFSAKFYNEPYLSVSDDLKRHIRQSMNSLKSAYDMSNQDISLLETLLKLLEVIDETNMIRKNLIRLRNELELWRTDENLPLHRKQLIDLTIEIINLTYYGTFFCSSLDKIMLKTNQFKVNIREIKDTNSSYWNKVDTTFIYYLYKLPMLIIIKRGLLDEFKKRKQAKIENLNNEPVNEANNDPE